MTPQKETLRSALKRLKEDEGIIDAGTLLHYLPYTPAGLRKHLAKHGIHPIGRGKYNRFLYNATDVYHLLVKHQKIE